MTDQEQRDKWGQDESRWRWAFGMLLSLLAGFLVQGSVAVWWAGALTERVGYIERAAVEDRTRMTEDRARVRTLAAEISADRIIAARLDQRLEAALAALERIERRLEDRE